jgi:hypothetical protein
MWPLALVPLYSFHSLVHHAVMNAVAPFYRAFDTFTKHSWVGRMTSMTTQVVVLPLLSYVGKSSNYHHVLAMYLLADMFHMSLYLRDDLLAWVHHVVCFLGYGVTFFVSEELLRVMVTGSLMLELTSPLIHLCWFANKAGYSGQRWFPVLAGLTLLNFFVVRCLWFPVFVWTSMPKSLWVFGITLQALNFMWFYKLVGYALAVVRKSGGPRLE